MKLSKKQKRIVGVTVVGAIGYLATGAFVTYQETGELKALLQPMNLLAWPYLLATSGDWALDGGASVSGSWAKLFTGATG